MFVSAFVRSLIGSLFYTMKTDVTVLKLRRLSNNRIDRLLVTHVVRDVDQRYAYWLQPEHLKV